MPHTLPRRSLLSPSLLASLAVLAVQPGLLMAADDLQWNGFLNVVGGSLRHEPLMDRTQSSLPPGRQGYTGQWQFDQQTSAGLQARKPLDDSTSVTVQVYAEGAVDNYAANMRWLYLTHALSDTQTLRVGRIGTPTYFFSDFFNVGYAYPWVTPPYEVYTYDSSMTGIDYVLQGYRDTTDWSLEAFYGSQNYHVPAPGNADVTTRNSWGVIASATHDGWLSTRLMLHENTEAIVIDGVDSPSLTALTFDVAADAGLTLDADTRAATAAAMRPRLDAITRLEDFRVRYANAAVKADLGPWLAMAEGVHYSTGQYLLGSVDAWFVTGGRRIDNTLIHLTYGRNQGQVDARARADATAGGATLGELFANAIGSSLAASIANNTRSVTLGARLDATSNTALKADLTWFREEASTAQDSYGLGENWLLRTALNVTF